MTITDNLILLFTETRQYTETLCKPLELEDYVIQPELDVSPPKWHLGHTTWFYEEFILKHHKPNYKLFHKDFAFAFNSYYEGIGKRIVRSARGNMSRPSVAHVYDYRHYVTNELKDLLKGNISEEIKNLLLMGVHHEKQHQELLMTDIKFILGNNPFQPKYNDTFIENTIEDIEQKWISIEEGIYEIGHENPKTFHYDNEVNRHKVYLHNYAISNKLVTNGEYLNFINAGGYKDFNFWHMEGWEWVKQQQPNHPMYWHNVDDKWHHYTLQGLQALDMDAPVKHISYFEAFAYAQWSGFRLPTEFEWEAANTKFKWGQRWEWTESAYLPYPNYKKAEGAIGEYNGKFMVNQKVLRGGSVVTPVNHTRPTYRNFFHAQLRWQFTGIRLAK
ncbi:ergothioneine biosynthesis protein EgtB [Patiriisocius marinistellae]|uniref:Ergothioneine biosynthesis protein EgtB n=1 Tax=Patiriisocius marinistellae TaxID=2494560 RepID=A0A5J4FZ70_9FLAO|nr:ergothioneine biosynthesis protein EgtB [Patiriisocius marinistellae]GEQ85469.1 ergothioneine biosynthesis protein EgtB [Patiriisocius marinistellae]